MMLDVPKVFRLSIFLFLAGLLGCGASPTNVPKAAQPTTAETMAERGPVKVTVSVAPEPARLSDEPTLTLTIEHPPGIEIEKPPFGDAMRDFLILDFREPLAEVRDELNIVRQIYRLEPTRTGALQIDPIPIAFTDNRPNGDGKRHILETDAITLNVRSMVDAEAPTLDALESFAEPVTVPAPIPRWVWVVATGSVVTAVAVGILLYRRNRRQATANVRQLSPRELAEQELEKLRREELFKRDVKLYYVELTAIVRRYIERTTGVRAAEQTTEEFLREISSGDRFASDERLRLRDFLESADLVKFAAHEPASTDIDEAFERARRFVGLTGQEIVA